MGLANLVPGISGGTMLLAAGVYPQFIEGIAEVTTLRFRARNLALLGAIGGAAAIGIISLAGLIPIAEDSLPGCGGGGARICSASNSRDVAGSAEGSPGSSGGLSPTSGGGTVSFGRCSSVSSTLPL